MRWCVAPAGHVRLKRSYKCSVPSREVDHRGRRQREPGRIQRPPALYIFRRYGFWPNDRRRGWWRLACGHTKSDVAPFSWLHVAKSAFSKSEVNIGLHPPALSCESGPELKTCSGKRARPEVLLVKDRAIGVSMEGLFICAPVSACEKYPWLEE